MVNLLDETRRSLAEHGKTEANVRWIGSADGTFVANWEDFASIADVDYDNGYGAQEVVRDLVVVGDDWWLERYEYDGAESWAFKSMPSPKPGANRPKLVVFGMWDTLAEAHAEA